LPRLTVPPVYLTTLYGHYDPIITTFNVNQIFTSHQFIHRLTQAFQQEYIDALYAVRTLPQPFRKLHNQISILLLNKTTVRKTGFRRPIQTVFGTMRLVTEWE
jgi:hypothetical protein